MRLCNFHFTWEIKRDKNIQSGEYKPMGEWLALVLSTRSSTSGSSAVSGLESQCRHANYNVNKYKSRIRSLPGVKRRRLINVRYPEQVSLSVIVSWLVVYYILILMQTYWIWLCGFFNIRMCCINRIKYFERTNNTFAVSSFEWIFCSTAVLEYLILMIYLSCRQLCASGPEETFVGQKLNTRSEVDTQS